MRLQTKFLILAGTAAIVATPVLVASAKDAPPRAADPKGYTHIPEDAPQHKISRVPDDLRASFELLRRNPTQTVQADGFSNGGLNRQLEQTVDTAVGPVRVVPGSSLLCVRLPIAGVGSAGSCGSTATAVQGKLWLALKQTLDGPATFVGLAPDGVSSVRVSETKTVPVRDNIWVATDVSPTSLVLLDESGAPVSTTTFGR